MPVYRNTENPSGNLGSSGGLLKVTVSGSDQHSQRDQSSTMNPGSTLYAGETLTMVGSSTGALGAEGFAVDGSNRTSGAQISLCIPPFCYGATVSASVQDSKGNIDSTYASVNRQSGFYAGSGGYDIET